MLRRKMGLFDFLGKLFFGSGPGRPMPAWPLKPRANPYKPEGQQRVHKKYPRKPFATNLRVPTKPYAMAKFFVEWKDGQTTRAFTDGRVGGDPARLQRFGLPRFETPEDLAQWLAVPLKTLAWLADYHQTNKLQRIPKRQHYHYKLVKKRGGGERVIEAPKPILKTIQQRILREILDRVPAHPAAHGFVKGRSIKTNAAPHAGNYVVIKVDLQDFYPRVNIKRVAAIFRGIGYNVEIAHWLSRLCTNQAAESTFPSIYFSRHLPQGAPTSPAIANLCAFALDVRLSGLAKKFGATYTRYADDMTFSGDEKLMTGKTPNWFMRYIRGIIKDERYVWNKEKKRVIRRGAPQIVTGLTVNEKANVPRKYFDELKAILHNCVKKGPATQNRAKVPDFKAHLRGRIEFVRSVNPEKAERLQKEFAKIKW